MFQEKVRYFESRVAKLDWPTVGRVGKWRASRICLPTHSPPTKEVYRPLFRSTFLPLLTLYTLIIQDGGMTSRHSASLPSKMRLLYRKKHGQCMLLISVKVVIAWDRWYCFSLIALAVISRPGVFTVSLTSQLHFLLLADHSMPVPSYSDIVGRYILQDYQGQLHNIKEASE